MKQLIKSIALCLSIALTVSCGTQQTQKESQSTAPIDCITLAGGVDWGAPSPYLHTARGPGNAKKDFIFASLLESDETGIVGWMAQSWEQEGDMLTFTLHPDATFHDGAPLTTADVAFTIDYTKEHPPISNTLGMGDAFLIASYDIVDAQTIIIKVNTVTADTLTQVGGMEILPKHIWQDVTDPENFTDPEAFIGSGAYQFTAYDAATGAYAFSAYDAFCAGTPAAQKVQFVPVSDALLAFDHGEIDLTEVPADLYDAYAKQEDIAMIEKANDMGYKMLINFETCPEFLDKALREALYAGINREAIVEKVFRGMGSVGSAGYVPSGSIYYNDAVAQYPYDATVASEAFSGEGMEITLLVSNYDKDLKIAQLMKADLESAGITLQVQALDSAAHTDAIHTGNYMFALVGNGGWGGCVPNYLRTVFSDVSKNTGGSPHTMGPIGWSNESITNLCEAQFTETDFDARVELFHTLQAEISEEIPLVVLATQSSYAMYDQTKYDGWMKTYNYQQVDQNRLSYIAR